MTKNNHVDEDISITFQFHVFLTKHALIVSVNKSQAKCDFNLRTLSRRGVINLCCRRSVVRMSTALSQFYFIFCCPF